MTVNEIESLVVGSSAVATVILSFLIWRANILSAKAAKGAADAAIESAKISNLMLEAQLEQKQNLHDQIKRDILKQIRFLLKILSEVKESSTPSQEMVRLPEQIHVTNYELANYFSKEERQKIYYTVEKYEAYRTNYFKDGKPSFNTIVKLTQDTDELIERAKDIIVKFSDKA